MSFPFKKRLKELLGPKWTKVLAKFKLRVENFFIAIFLSPALIYLILDGRRVLNVNVKRVGHQILDFDSVVKEAIINGRVIEHKFILPAPLHLLANKHILNYQRRYMKIATNPIVGTILYFLGRRKILTKSCAHYSEGPGAGIGYLIHRQWGPRAPLYKLTTNDQLRGQQFLDGLGIKADDWFVCVHNRESGYSYSQHSKGARADFYQEYRNCDIDTYDLAVQEIIDQGGWVFRVGDSTMKPIRAKDRYIDYAHSALRADWLDIYLCARSKFFLGNTSGAYLMASMFGTPVALANMVPIGASYALGVGDISIPKLYRSKVTGKYLKFSQVSETILAATKDSRSFQQEPIFVEDSSPEDIRDLAVEQLRKVNGEYKGFLNEGNLQERYRSLMTSDMQTYYSSANIASFFLKKYSGLL